MKDDPDRAHLLDSKRYFEAAEDPLNPETHCQHTGIKLDTDATITVNDEFFQEHILLLLFYSSAFILDYRKRVTLSVEEHKKIAWFFENIQRVVYKKLPMTPSP